MMSPDFRPRTAVSAWCSRTMPSTPPHCGKNIQFPLENLKGADKLSKEEMSKRVLEAAKLVQIDHLLERKPNELSAVSSSVLPSPEP